MAIGIERAPSIERLAPSVIAAAAALLVSTFWPLAGPLLIALVLGAIAANSRLAALPAMRDQAATTKVLLRLGVVLLGLKLPVRAILDIGPSGMAVVVTTVAVTYTSTIWIGDRLDLDRGFVTLLASGFAICGAAAIAAVDDAVRAKERYVALAVAMVTVFGSAMILIVPWLSRTFGLSDRQSAMWAGASIHEVAQVVAAASIIGSGALAIATTVKLGRVVLLAPTYAVASRRGARNVSHQPPALPWFVIGFAIAVAVRTLGLLDHDELHIADLLTTFLLAAGMFGLGIAIKAKELWPVPLNALLLAATSTVIAAGTSLVLIVALT